nr:class I SAM-dependent methyltransferase [Candidatus Dependentiae bacterium]
MDPEIKRIKQEYSKWDNSEFYKSNKQPTGISGYYFSALLRELFFLLNKCRIFNFENKKIFEVGCGEGGNLPLFLKYGIFEKDYYGADVIDYRLKIIKKKYQSSNIFSCDGRTLSLKDKKFDIVTQFFVFSSILEDDFCRRIACEMLRVLKDDGIIIWFDSYGKNNKTGITRQFDKNCIKNFFPDCSYEFRKIIPHSQ